MSHKEILTQLTPLPLEGVFEDDITIEGDHLDSAETSGQTLLANLVPNSTNEDLIETWESTFQIVPEAGATLADRYAMIITRLRARGALNAQYFIDLAAKLGYTVEIEDMRPFESGLGMTGYPIWEEGIKWCWLVRVLDHTTQASDFDGKTAAAYTAAGVGWLWTWDVIAGPMERLFNDLKKSGGVVLFVYPN